MPDRRNLLALGVAGAAAGVIGKPISAAPTARGVSRLETRLFNFKDTVSPETATDSLASFKRRAKAARVGGLLVGRNYIPEQFPTRFEWIYMLQINDFARRAGDPAREDLKHACDELTGYCRNEAQGDLDLALPPKFADAPGVTVRHVVMFNFKPEASDEARRRNVGAIRAMGELPMVRNYIVAPCNASLVGANQMQWQVIGDFGSAEDYMSYAKAPVHLAIREDFTAHTSRVAFLDVQV